MTADAATMASNREEPDARAVELLAPPLDTDRVGRGSPLRRELACDWWALRQVVVMVLAFMSDAPTGARGVICA